MADKITREDGVAFSVNNRRYSLQKQSKKNLEMSVGRHFDGDRIPDSGRFCILSSGAEFMVVAGIGGFPLGESVLDAIDCENFILCESFREGFVVIICRNGEIIADSFIEDTLDDSLIGVLVGIDTPVDLFEFGDIQDLIKSAISPDIISKTHTLDESVVNSIHPKSHLKLLLWKEAVKNSGIYRFENFIQLGAVVGSICLLAYILWPQEEQSTIDPLVLERNRLETEYQQLLNSSNLVDAVLMGERLIDEVNNAYGWNFKELTLNQDGIVQIKFIGAISNFNPDADVLQTWAMNYGYTLNWISSSEAEATKTVSLPLLHPNEMSINLAQRYAALNLNEVPSVNFTLEMPVQMGVYTIQNGKLIIQGSMPESITAGVKVIESLPVVFSTIRWEPAGYFYNASVDMQLVGRN